jgi:hypothetical protein
MCEVGEAAVVVDPAADECMKQQQGGAAAGSFA